MVSRPMLPSRRSFLGAGSAAIATAAYAALATYAQERDNTRKAEKDHSASDPRPAHVRDFGYFSGYTLMLRKKTSAPSDWKRILPLAGKASVPSLASLPFTYCHTCPSRFTSSTTFHFPCGFSSSLVGSRKPVTFLNSPLLKRSILDALPSGPVTRAPAFPSGPIPVSAAPSVIQKSPVQPSLI